MAGFTWSSWALRPKTLQVMAAAHALSLSLITQAISLPFFVRWLLDSLLIEYVTLLYLILGPYALLGVLSECLFMSANIVKIIIMMEDVINKNAYVAGCSPQLIKVALFWWFTLYPLQAFILSIPLAKRVAKRFQLKQFK